LGCGREKKERVWAGLKRGGNVSSSFFEQLIQTIQFKFEFKEFSFKMKLKQ